VILYFVAVVEVAGGDSDILLSDYLSGFYPFYYSPLFAYLKGEFEEY